MGLKIFAVVLGLPFLACGIDSTGELYSGPDGLEVTAQGARVTPQQAAQATLAADSTRAYLPFAFTQDGCYGRALYMSMELAGWRIPSSAQYITGNLLPSSDVAWSWHVAPMVQLIGSSERSILDPALAPAGPVSVARWIELTKPRGSYRMEWTLGSQYINDGSVRRNVDATPVIESFAQMTPFRARDIEQACDVMYWYLSYEGNTPSELQRKRGLLLSRTRTLANRLATVGKISGYQTGGALRCGAMSVPMCREAGASCSTASNCCSTGCVNGTCQALASDLAIASGGSATPAPTPEPIEPSGPPALSNGSVVTGLSGAKGDAVHYQFEVPAGATSLRFELRGSSSSGDADIYVRYGEAPTSSRYDYRPYLEGSNETVSVSAPSAGTWFVVINGYTAFSGVSVNATHSSL